MNPKITVQTPAWIVTMLAFSAVAAIGVGTSSVSGVPPTAEAVTGAVEEGQESPRAQDNPLRIQGPAVDVPQEILDMLNQRQRAVERREEAMHTEEMRLLSLKKDIEGTLACQQSSSQAQIEQTTKQKSHSDTAAKAIVDQVVKMYETMPPEEAAARLEKLPTEMALQVLRSLKGKTAGSILASVRPDKAAKLTERFLASAPVKSSKAVR